MTSTRNISSSVPDVSVAGSAHWGRKEGSKEGKAIPEGVRCCRRSNAKTRSHVDDGQNLQTLKNLSDPLLPPQSNKLSIPSVLIVLIGAPFLLQIGLAVIAHCC